MNILGTGEELIQFFPDILQKSTCLGALYVPGPAVFSEQGCQSGILIQHNMFSTADSASRSMAKMVEHRNCIHTHVFNFPDQNFQLVF